MSTSERLETTGDHQTSNEKLLGKDARKRSPERQNGASSVPGKKLKESHDQETKSYENSPKEFLNKFLDPLMESSEDYVLNNWLFCKHLLKTPLNCNSCSSPNLRLLQSCDQWECVECTKRFCIRTGSFFQNLPISIKEVISCILAWSRQESPDKIRYFLGLRKPIVEIIYQQCLNTILSYMKEEFSRNWVLGGPGSVALLDVWPHGYIPACGHSEEIRRSYRDRLRVLWIADTNHVPVRYMAQLLPPLKPPQKARRNIPITELWEDYNMLTGFTDSLRPEVQDRIGDLCDGKQKKGEHDRGISDSSHEERCKRVLKEQQELINTREDFKHYRGESDQKIKNTKLKQPKTKQLHHDYEMDQDEPYLQENGESEIPDEHKSVVNRETNEIQGTDEGENTMQKYKDRPEGSKLSKQEILKKKKAEQRRLQLTREFLQQKDAVLSLALDHIAPGSLVVVNEQVFPGIINTLNACGQYETVRSVSDLKAVDETEGWLTIKILENIWKNAAKLCEDVKRPRYTTANNRIVEFQWRHMFGSSHSRAAYHILSQIASYYVPKPITVLESALKTVPNLE